MVITFYTSEEYITSGDIFIIEALKSRSFALGLNWGRSRSEKRPLSQVRIEVEGGHHYRGIGNAASTIEKSTFPTEA